MCVFINSWRHFKCFFFTLNFLALFKQISYGHHSSRMQAETNALARMQRKNTLGFACVRAYMCPYVSEHYKSSKTNTRHTSHTQHTAHIECARAVLNGMFSIIINQLIVLAICLAYIYAYARERVHGFGWRLRASKSNGQLLYTYISTIH